MWTASTLRLANDTDIPVAGESQSVRSASLATKPEQIGRKKAASKRLYRFALVLPVLLLGGISNAQYQQYPVMEGVATRVIQKYQQSSCDQLWQQRGQPRSQRE